MSSLIAAVAGEVVTQLNLGAFSQEFTATRAYRVAVDRADLDDLRVVVTPNGATSEIVSRSHTEQTIKIDVGVQKQVNPDSLTDGDAMLALLGEIRDEFLGESYTVSGQIVSCDEVASDPLFMPEHLDQHRVFTGVVTLGFSTVKSR